MLSSLKAFEKTVRELDWPEDKWTSLEQSLKVSYAALDANNNRDFETVQNAVLAAYEVVATAYTQM